MRSEFTKVLACPECAGDLNLTTEKTEGGEIIEGTLACSTCEKDYAITKGIPRFVANDEYAGSFGWQWDKFRATQVDAFSGTHESERRFAAETACRPEDLRDRLVLDMGCGAGRFSAVAAEWGACVVAVDLTAGAIEACATTMRALNLRVDTVQASIYALPFRPGTFDLVFSLGVIQHTPDPVRALRMVPPLLKPGGRAAFWIYEKRWTRFLFIRNYLRRATRHLPLAFNYRLSLALVSVFFPITLIVSRVPGLRKAVPLFPISSRHYWGRLSIRQQWDWTLLDTFDSYSPRYENNMSEREVFAALAGSPLEQLRRTAARGMAIVGVRAGGAAPP